MTTPQRGRHVKTITLAALAMSGSSALVEVNALMLSRTRLAGITR